MAVRAGVAVVVLSVLVMTLLRRCQTFGDNWIGLGALVGGGSPPADQHARGSAVTMYLPPIARFSHRVRGMDITRDEVR